MEVGGHHCTFEYPRLNKHFEKELQRQRKNPKSRKKKAPYNLSY
jgi:hypothetical protein